MHVQAGSACRHKPCPAQGYGPREPEAGYEAGRSPGPGQTFFREKRSVIVSPRLQYRKISFSTYCFCSFNRKVELTNKIVRSLLSFWKVQQRPRRLLNRKRQQSKHRKKIEGINI